MQSESGALLKLLQYEPEELTETEDSCIIFYIAGAFAQSVAKELQCLSCTDLVKVNREVYVRFQENDQEKEKAKEEFIMQVNKGGLAFPSDIFYVACIHAWKHF